MKTKITRTFQRDLNKEGAGLKCVLCGTKADPQMSHEFGIIKGNTSRFKDEYFPLWKCPKCQSVHSMKKVDMADIYKDYPPHHQKLDPFTRGTTSNLMTRLRQAGMRKDSSILDFGCGGGVLVRLLEQKGYGRVQAYDPFVSKYSRAPAGIFEWIIANDVIEHVDDPWALLSELAQLMGPNSYLYLGTADSGPLKMDQLEREALRLHQPFHRVLVNEEGLRTLVDGAGFEIVRSFRRSYMDTVRPFANYRFLDEFTAACDDDLDHAMSQTAYFKLLTHPRLWFWGFFGYFFSSANEPALILRKKGN